MRKVAIVQGNCLTPLGDLDQTWAGLLAGEPGLVKQGFGHCHGEWPLGLISQLGADQGGAKRLADMFDILLHDLPALPENTQLICSTTKGGVDDLTTDPHSDAGQPWAVGAELSKRLGLSGSPLMISAACASGAIAVINGAMRIAMGECDNVLVIGFDLISNFVLSGFDSLKALSPDGAKPFDIDRNGLSLGEAGGWLLLSAADEAADESGILGLVDGWAVSCDATHITAPCRQGSGLKRVLQQIKQGSGVTIGGINAHGTGTVYNDAMELLAFSECCDDRTPLCSVKGSLGHSLAAAGVIETLLSSKSLHHGFLPPTYGLERAAESRCLVSGQNELPLTSNSILSTNSGFGGINSGILLTSPLKPECNV